MCTEQQIPGYTQAVRGLMHNAQFQAAGMHQTVKQCCKTHAPHTTTALSFLHIQAAHHSRKQGGIRGGMEGITAQGKHGGESSRHEESRLQKHLTVKVPCLMGPSSYRAETAGASPVLTGNTDVPGAGAAAESLVQGNALSMLWPPMCLVSLLLTLLLLLLVCCVWCVYRLLP